MNFSVNIPIYPNQNIVLVPAATFFSWSTIGALLLIQIHMLQQCYDVLIRSSRLAVGHSVVLNGGNKFNLKLKFQNKFKLKLCWLLASCAKAQCPVQWWQQWNESTTADPNVCQTAKQRMARATEECTDSAATNSKAHVKSQPQIKLTSFHHQKHQRKAECNEPCWNKKVLFITSRPRNVEFGSSSINYPFMPLMGISGPMICKTK